jgi:hypothetical protein
VTPTLFFEAACVAENVELSTRAAPAASERLKIRIAPPPICLGHCLQTTPIVRGSSLPSLWVISQCNRHVRFTPESRHVQRSRSCPLWANSGHHGRSLFDQLFCELLEMKRHVQPQRFGALEVGNKLILRRRLYRLLAGFSPFRIRSTSQAEAQTRPWQNYSVLLRCISDAPLTACLSAGSLKYMHHFGLD